MTDSIEQLQQVGRRNNVLSNSLQMLGKSMEPANDSRNYYNANNAILSSHQQSNNRTETSDQQLRLATNVHRSASNERLPGEKGGTKKSRQNAFEKSRGSNDRIKVIQAGSINQLRGAQKGMTVEKRTIQQVSQNNQRRNGGTSSANNLAVLKKEDQTKHNSLVIPTSKNSIVLDQKGKSGQDATMTFQVGEYGPMSLNDDGFRRSMGQAPDLNENRERKNVPISVNNQRQQYLSNDYQHKGQRDERILSGGGGVHGNFTTSASLGLQSQQPLDQPGSMQRRMTQDKNISKAVKARAEKSRLQSQSNHSFQSAAGMQNEQRDGTFQKVQVNRAFKSGNVGASHRTRISQIESSSNIWEVPLSQKLEFSQLTDSMGNVNRFEQNKTVKPHDKSNQLMMLQNIPQNKNNRMPDFRNSTTLPKSYKQFVATVNSGQQQQQLVPQTQQPSGSIKQQGLFSSSNQNMQDLSLFKQSMTNFQNTHFEVASAQPSASNSQFQKRAQTKKKKDELLQMISNIEFGDNSETFRALAKQFYIQNLQKDNNRYLKKRQPKPEDSSLLTSPPSGLIPNKTMTSGLFSKTQTGLQQPSQVLPNEQLKTGDKQQPDILALQKQLWQQFQLLRILKQTKYQHQLQKCQQRGDGSQPNKGPPGSQTLEYGFEMTEEQMYQRLFLKQANKDQKHENGKDDKKDGSQPYASFDCPECVQMASQMLDEELRYYMAKSSGKRKGSKSKDAIFRHQKNGQQHKGIAGLSTQGVSMKGTRVVEDVDNPNYPAILQDNIFQKGNQNSKRSRAQTQHAGPNAKQRGGNQQPQVMDDSVLVGQIFVNRAQPQVFFKKQLNHSFRQVVRGEQMTQHMKQNSIVNCTCGAAATQQPASASQQRPRQPPQQCVCSQTKRNFEEPVIPFQYSFQQKQTKQTKITKLDRHHGKQIHGHEGSHSHVQNNAAVALDGTVQGHKRKYKPANGIYQPPLQPFKHLATSPVNQTITKVNELVLILFKQKMKTSDQHIIKLFKFFGIPVPRGNGCILDTKVIKMPDFLHSVNQKLLIKLYKVLNHENAKVKPETSTQIFRFYVGKGNNYPSVRQIISRRSWWNRGNNKQEKFYGQKAQGYETDDMASSQNGPLSDDQVLSNKQFASGCHFIWTQWRKTEHSEFLKRVTIDKKKQKKSDTMLKQQQSAKKLSKEGESKKIAPLSVVPTLIYNRLDDNYHLSNKKALFLNISAYYQAMGINPFEVAIPLTFNVKAPNNTDSEFVKFTRSYNQFQKSQDANIWIIKPGENSNQGNGIEVASSLNEIKQKVSQLSSKNGNRTSIVQKYLDKPLLIHGRKFDIRGYAMITSVNGVMKGYMYRDCYFRTSSKQFDLTNLHSRFIHLTNDAIQLGSEDYGRFESGNKLSINDFQRYLDANHTSKNVVFMRDLFPQMERLVTDSFRAVGSKIDPNRLSNCFEIFGYDFMIDENFKVFMIEANTNPSLEICSPLLARIIPELLDNSFRVAIDPLYQPSQFLAKLRDDAAVNGDKVDLQSKDINLTVSKERSAQVTEGDNSLSPNRKPGASVGKEVRSRQRLELLTQIKYTLIYDERIDKPVVDKILADYEKRQNQEHQSVPVEGGAQQALIGKEGFTSQNEGGDSQPVLSNERQLFREIVEEEKLDEQAAKKEEIEAAEDEAAGIIPQPLMLMQPMGRAVASEEEDDDDIESEEDFFN